MRRKTDKSPKSYTLPSSPTHSSSSSDFEFAISLSPRKSSSSLCPADELFYNGQLLPLHLSPRLSMVRTLLLASSSTSSPSDTTATPSRDSTGSSSSDDSNTSFSGDLVLLAAAAADAATDCDSSRPSSVTEYDGFKLLNHQVHHHHCFHPQTKKPKYFSLSRFSSVFRKEPKTHHDPEGNPSGSSVKRKSATAKEVILKYLKKVRPLYEKLSQKQQQKMAAPTRRMTASANDNSLFVKKDVGSTKANDFSIHHAMKERGNNNTTASMSHSFSGDLRFPTRRRSCISSCPSSMRSSPSHSGILSRGGFTGPGRIPGMMNYSDTSSMEELQSAIQGAIEHCKNSMMQN